MSEVEKKRIKPVIEEVIEDTPKEEVVKAADKTPDVLPVETAAPEPRLDVKEKPKKEDRKMNIKLVIIIMFLSAIVAAVVSGGVYVYLSGIKPIEEVEKEEVVEPTVSPSSTPEPTKAPEAEVDLSEFSVQVLNGNGVTGSAGKLEKVLTEAGFSVKNTANAQSSNYVKTTIQSKAAVSASVIAKVRATLTEAEYEVEVGDALPASGSYDIVVVTGKN